MPREQFFYSKWFAWWPFVYISFFFGPITYYNHVRSARWHNGRLFEPWEFVIMVVLLGFLVWQFVKYLLPVLQKKTFIELDDDKIDLRYKQKVIYWDDVIEAKYRDFSKRVILKLKDNRKIRIPLACIGGDDDYIQKTIIDYYKQANPHG